MSHKKCIHCAARQHDGDGFICTYLEIRLDDSHQETLPCECQQ